MKALNLSNSCINCGNSMTCGVHQIDVSEKYTCSEFDDSTSEA